MKVAIIGLSPSGREDIPWADDSWERWGMPWDGHWAGMTRLFEMHDLRLLKSEHCRRKPGYLELLRECGVPLYMQEAYPEIPEALDYPFEAVAGTCGWYWNSSIAYMTAMAIHEGATEIAIYGVDMKADDEYGYQKPNMEYLLGLAKGRGIKVTVPDASPLLKFNPIGVRFFDHIPTYFERYGWLG